MAGAVMKHRSHGQRADAGYHLLPTMEALMRGLILATTVILGIAGPAVAQDHKAQAMTGDALKWGPAPLVNASAEKEFGGPETGARSGPRRQELAAEETVFRVSLRLSDRKGEWIQRGTEKVSLPGLPGGGSQPQTSLRGPDRRNREQQGISRESLPRAAARCRVQRQG